MAASIRPTKKQRELLDFIARFIEEHGYSPSYREIMTGLNYTSVATVAVHVNNLIRRGHLRKRDRSARSLEVVHVNQQEYAADTTDITEDEAKWLVRQVEARFAAAEGDARPDQTMLDELFVLVGAMKILGLDEAVSAYLPRLNKLKKTPAKPKPQDAGKP